MSDKAEDSTLPEAPQHKGVDPLTDGNTYYGQDVKGESKFGDRPTDEEVAADEASDTTVADQEERNAVANTPDAVLNDQKEDVKTDESDSAKPAKKK